ncbi:Ubiquitin thioesterase OTU1 [Diplonema papillatum]|nr:Ubiquitin thioesterase OTU1 [Diplonema papillatum]
MASQLCEILGISEKQAEGLLKMTDGDVNKAVNIYVSTQSSPAGKVPRVAEPEVVAAPAAASTTPEPLAPRPYTEEPAEQQKAEWTVEPGGKMLRLRLAGEFGQHDVTVDEHTPLGKFCEDIAEAVAITAPHQQLMGGFPPKPLPCDDTTATLKALGVKSGSRLTIDKKDRPTEMKKGKTAGVYVPPSDSKGHFTKREMPGDNSCLFHAIDYTLNKKSSTNAQSLRDEIAEIVQSDKAKFTTEFLGMPNATYAQWIKNKDTWGGGIELSILSYRYQTEICALDIQTKRVHRFGEDEPYTVRCFLLYSGKHYDAMALAPFGGATIGDQVVFSKTDEGVFKKALSFLDSEHQQAKAKGS